MTTFYRFPCGCQWPVVGPAPRDGALPLMDVDDENLPFCPATWELLARGNTKGVFQLESSLGRTWTKKLKPESGEHIGALGAILRPGCLRAVDADGVSMTQHFCRRKNNQEDVPSYHPAIDRILAPTQGCLVYQEQAMQIAQAVAGFNLQDADSLRKAIGKKLAEEMAKCKKMFMEGAAKAGIITTEQAEEVFGWIEKSQRYGFNKCISDRECLKRTAKGRFAKSDTPLTIGEMYRIRHDLEYAKSTGHEQLRRKWKRLGNYGKGLSMSDDGRIRPNTIVDIQPAGRRAVYKLMLENGSTICVTENHKFPTNQGEMTVSAMMECDGPLCLFVCGEYERRCQVFGTTQKRLELHHRDGNRAGSLANLIRLCSSCHKKWEYVAGRTKRGEKSYPSIPVRLAKIELDREEMTYDVTMEGPNHNFVVGSGIVTCNSHAMGYGLTGYDTAYIKAHFPVAFYCSWLRFARDKQDPMREVYELVNDARLNDVDVLPPDLRNMEPHFATDGVVVTFGLSDIKGIGVGQIVKIKAIIEKVEKEIGKPLKQWRWLDFLFFVSHRITSSTVIRLVLCGALDWLGEGRQQMLADFDAWADLTECEQEWILSRERLGRKITNPEDVVPPLPPEPSEKDEKYREAPEKTRSRLVKTARAAWAKKASKREALISSLRDISPFASLYEAIRAAGRTKKDGGGAVAKRVETLQGMATLLERPPSPVVDMPDWVAWNEEQFLGIALTCSRVDAFDLRDVNTSCKDFASGKTGYMVLGVQVKQVREVKTKNGKNPGQKMAFLTIADSTCALSDVICFPEMWKEYSGLLTQDRCVIIQGERDDKQGSLLVKKVSEMV